LSWIEFETSVLRIESIGIHRLFHQGGIQPDNVHDIEVTLEEWVTVGNPHEGSSAQFPQVCLGKGRYRGYLLDARISPLQSSRLEVIKPFEGVERMLGWAVS
jgi:hypothetical protein